MTKVLGGYINVGASEKLVVLCMTLEIDGARSCSLAQNSDTMHQ